jgi:hypothetical protein
MVSKCILARITLQKQENTTEMLICTSYFVKIGGEGGLAKFLPELGLLISTSQVSGVTGVSHCTWL